MVLYLWDFGSDFFRSSYYQQCRNHFSLSPELMNIVAACFIYLELVFFSNLSYFLLLEKPQMKEFTCIKYYYQCL